LLDRRPSNLSAVQIACLPFKLPLRSCARMAIQER
jgi:hypothetical protein